MDEKASGLENAPVEEAATERIYLDIR